ncbi:MAG: response regulator [Acidimicrobiales bacterium]|nr:response regulator [Acidimicrobiales bacterium]
MQSVEPSSILLVEDNPDDVELTRIAMLDAGIEADLSVVYDGREALRFLRQEAPWEHVERPDLILLDLNLPQLDGRQLLKMIKDDPELRSIPVIVLTTSVDDHDVSESYRSGANSFISKPADFDLFVTTLRSLQEFWFATAVLPPRHRN